MGVKSNFDPAALIAQINQIGDKAHVAVTRIMEEEAEKMAEIARSNAPRQLDHEGTHLEDAIFVEKTRDENRRTQFEVKVDEDAAGKGGKPIGEYALIMHEGLAPYGSGAYNLDEGSIAKATAGHDVGGKYMARAFQKRSLALWTRAQAAVRRLLAK